ncbi:MAG: ribonuclease Y [Candidatus Peregrinibacteria bacterium]
MNTISVIIGLVIGAGVIFTYFKTSGGQRLKKMEQEGAHKISEAQKRIEDAERQALQAETKLREKIIEGKNKAIEIIEEAKKEEKEIRRQLEKTEERLIQKEEQCEKKTTEAEKVREEYRQKIEHLKQEEERLEAIIKEQDTKLQAITKLTTEGARKMLLENLEKEYRGELVAHYKRIESDIKEESTKEAKNLIVQAVQKYASDVTSEATQTLVELPNDEIKGRVIGREGRNINAFEHLTGVDVIVDDTPGAIVISGFDLVRRFIAKRALEKLVEDGRIQPARIEQVVEQTKEEIHTMMKEFGEKAVYEIGITGLHPDLVKIVGRLRFRTSYGQNVLKHSMEVGFIAGHLAAELGLDVNHAKMAGFLHDIGKAVDHEIEGSHALIGRDIVKKFGLPEVVVHAIAAHHEEVKPETSIDFLVLAADAISASRPGARRETLETYLRRLRELEDLANSFKGVDKCYAIQAGREIRVMVRPNEIDDLGAIKLSHEIARRIESELAYPGTIKVNVLRETRSIDVAR